MPRKAWIETLRELLRHPIVPRILKFGVVGTSSTIIDTVLFNLLYYGLDWQTVSLKAAANICSFSIAVTNGFLWNRFWTFGSPEGHVPTQYAKFVIVNLVGLVIDTVVVLAIWPLLQAFVPEKLVPTAAKITAIPPVAIWNFTAHSLWTFAPGKSRNGTPDVADAPRAEG